MSDPIPMRHLQGGWVVLHGKCKHCGELIMRFRFKEGQQWWWHTDFATGKTYRLCTPGGGRVAIPDGNSDE